MLKVNSIVTVYEDAITKLIPEGDAKILRHINNDFYVVRFLSDGFECSRFIIGENK